MADQTLRNQLLLAMPQRVQGEFTDSVIYIVEHNEDGAMGLVVNKPGDLKLRDVLTQLEIDAHVALDRCVFWGGPVQTDRGFVLHLDEGEWDSTLHIEDSLAVTTSRDILEAIGNGFGPSRYLITQGYSGWGAGQLEKELQTNSWLTTPNSTQILFDTEPAARWAAAARQLGLEAHQLTGYAGHA